MNCTFGQKCVLGDVGATVPLGDICLHVMHGVQVQIQKKNRRNGIARACGGQFGTTIRQKNRVNM